MSPSHRLVRSTMTVASGVSGGSWNVRGVVVRAIGVVGAGAVSDVVDGEAFKLSAVPGDGSVEEFASDRSDPALGERVGHRRPWGRLENLEALAPEDLVERVDELATSIAYQCTSPLKPIAVYEEQVGGGLGGLLPSGTTASDHCSTPADPTGTCCHRHPNFPVKSEPLSETPGSPVMWSTTAES